MRHIGVYREIRQRGVPHVQRGREHPEGQAVQEVPLAFHGRNRLESEACFVPQVGTYLSDLRHLVFPDDSSFLHVPEVLVELAACKLFEFRRDCLIQTLPGGSFRVFVGDPRVIVGDFERGSDVGEVGSSELVGVVVVPGVVPGEFSALLGHGVQVCESPREPGHLDAAEDRDVTTCGSDVLAHGLDRGGVRGLHVHYEGVALLRVVQVRWTRFNMRQVQLIIQKGLQNVTQTTWLIFLQGKHQGCHVCHFELRLDRFGKSSKKSAR